jgi:eukaryotic-like serine/threonine-protein kinase
VYDDLPVEVTDTNASFLDAVAAVSAEAPATSLETGPGGAGTLGYIDPECVSTGEPATPASDLYALGAMLFECLSGKLPCAAGRARGIDRAVLNGTRRAPPFLEVLPDAPPALARIIDALLAPARRDRPKAASFVAVELERLRIALSGIDRALPPEDVGPFRGLGRFEEGDRDVYFGRAGEVAAALDLLRGLGLLALIGASGSGKSSLARAGVLPRVAEGALGGWPERWDTAIVTPGNDARGSVAAALAALDPPLPGAWAMTPEALIEALRGAPRAPTGGSSSSSTSSRSSRRS